jgi:hypothetical protein
MYQTLNQFSKSDILLFIIYYYLLLHLKMLTDYHNWEVKW